MRWLFFLFFVSNVALFGWYQYQRDYVPPRAKPAVNAGPSIGLELLTELEPERLPSLREEADGAPSEVPSASQEEEVSPEAAVVSAESAEELPSEQTDASAVSLDQEDSEPTEVTETTEVAEATGTAPATPESPAPKPTCYRITGIRDQVAVVPLAERLQKRGAKVTGKGSTELATYRYWVMFPPFRNQAAAGSVVRELQRRRVKDFFLVRSGEKHNAISLGVFSTAGAAKRRFDEIRRLRISGATPRIERVEALSKRWWVSFSDGDAGEQSHWMRVLQLRDGAELVDETCR